MDAWPDGQPSWADGYAAGRRLSDTDWLLVTPLTLGRGRVLVGDAGGPHGDFY